MVRRLDDTRVGEYKNNWLFELFQLLIAILGSMSVFLVPIIYNGEKGVSPIIYLFSEPSNMFAEIFSIVLVAYFGFLLLNIFLILAIHRINASVYVKVSKTIEMILGVALIGLIGYYLYSQLGHGIEIFKKIFIDMAIYMGIVEFSVLSSIFMYFNSKKVSIYD